jgi:hypothetical protein
MNRKIPQPPKSRKIFRKIPVWLILLGLILTASGCSQTETPVVYTSTPPAPTIPLSSPTVQEDFHPTFTPEETPQSRPVPLERPQYSLAAVFDYPNQRVVVEEKILIPHPVNYLLNNIDLVVPPNSWPGVFSIQEISAGDLPVDGYDTSGVILRIDFGSPGWQPGENLDLQIQFTLDLPEQNAREGFGPSPFGYTTLQTNLVDWYPMVAPYQEDLGWVIHEPWLFGEYLVYPAADFEISLELGTPGLIAAASSAPLNEGTPLLYSLEAARNFVFSISPAYTVLEEDLNGTRVMGYIFPGYQVPGQAAFDATVEALKLYSELFGPYDQPSLSMVQADFNHGMEYEGLYFQSRGFFDTYGGSEKSYLVTIAVHETAHQWWYGRVANDQALEPWLDEALCTFSELVYYEQLYPQSADWWWATRVNFYEPYGRIDRPIYGFQDFVDQYLNYRNATYLQGAKFMAALKDELGDEQLYSFLREYAARYQDQIVTAEDFFLLLGEYLDLDSLTWLGDYFELE